MHLVVHTVRSQYKNPKLQDSFEIFSKLIYKFIKVNILIIMIGKNNIF